MKRLVASVKRWWFLERVTRRVGGPSLSPGERAALRTLLLERTFASYHREGLEQIARQSLTRPAKLNLGSGCFPKEGFLNVDFHPKADVKLDLRLPLPFESNCCELIFSEHCFEHFDYPEPIASLLREGLRVLKPGGMLSFSVPGTEWPLNDYRDGPAASYFQACDEHHWHPEDCTTRLEHINYHFRQGAEHRFAYDFETAKKLLTRVGFVDVLDRPFDPALDSEHRRVGSLFVSGHKQA